MARTEKLVFCVVFLIMNWTNSYSGQRLGSIADTCTGPDETDILKKELSVLQQLVKDQAIKMDNLKGELYSVKQKLSTCCSSVGPLPSGDDGHYGKEFLIAFPKSKGSVTKVQVLITAKEDAFVVFDSAHPGVNNTFQVSANAGKEVSLPVSVAMDSDGIFSKAVTIRSSHAISVHCVIQCGCSAAEGFLVFPSRYLGTKYLLSNSDFANIAIASQYKNTTIKLTILSSPSYITWKGVNYTENEVLHMDQTKEFQTFQFSATGYLFGVIESSNPIAVISGSYSDSSIFEANSAMEYMIPVKNFDFKYIIPNFAESRQDTYQFQFQDHNENSVTIPGIDVKRGGGTDLFYYAYGNQLPCIAKANEIMMPVVFSSYESTFMTLIPSKEQFSNDYRFLTPSTSSFRHYVVMTILATQINGILIDSKPIQKYQNNMKSVTNSDTGEEYITITIEVSNGFHHIYHTDSDVTFGLILYGYGTSEKISYGYPAGLRLK
ncbi:IgGFc-binding protein-like [Saccostrea cucullata]|uniref:IgGFc-binding protein-like n=1 Tax=Saccostrea cuccullata TaxID=36930 RepID=UPI002ED4A0A5